MLSDINTASHVPLVSICISLDLFTANFWHAYVLECFIYNFDFYQV